ncbi:SdrD B-like domain-containing protein [Spirosoma sordidisoli]|nr:SdrD B-like domain-containing protein [Spirosoma sordidisoli]
MLGWLLMLVGCRNSQHNLATQRLKNTGHSLSFFRLHRVSWRLSLPLFIAFCALLIPEQLQAQLHTTTSNAPLLARNQTGLKPLANQPSDATRQRVGKTMTRERALLKFEQNQGQVANSSVRYRANDAQATYFFTPTEIRSVVRSARTKDSTQAGYAIQFVNPNPEVALLPAGRVGGKHGTVNYITSEGAFSDVTYFQKLNYENIWTGIRADFYEGDNGTLKYDFVVQPGADPAQIRFRMAGVTDLHVTDKGELAFTTPFGTLQKGKPYTYQTINGKRVEVAAAYVVKDGEVSFQLEAYDPAVALVIDPIALKWSSFLGGTNLDISLSIYVHPTTGRIYVSGYTGSTNFPNTLGRVYGGGQDAYVTCIEKDGTSIVWSTYLGGSGIDKGFAVSADAAGDVYLAGVTNSPNFPTNGSTAAYDATHNGGFDLFVLRLNSTGTTLKYSTYLGSSGADGDQSNSANTLVLNNGTVYYASYGSTGFPLTAGSTSGSSVIFGINTNVAGAAGLAMSVPSNGYGFTDIAGDKDGNLWAVGITESTQNPLISSNAVQPTVPTTNNDYRYVAKYSPSGTFLYGSYINPIISTASTFGPFATEIATDAQGNVYVTSSVYYEINNNTGLLQKVSNTDAFNEITPISSSLRLGDFYGTYIVKIPYDLSPKYNFVTLMPGAMPVDNFEDPEIAIDKKGNIHFVTWGGNFYLNQYHPVTPGAILPITSSERHPEYYVLSPSGASVLYGTALSKDISTNGIALFVNDKCEAYITIEASSQNKTPITPTYRDQATNSQKSVFQPTYGGGTDVALLVFHEPVPNNNTIPNFAAGNNTFCIGGAIWQNPNDGPILGATPTYQSGSGSSATDNLPNILIDGALSAHPTPKSPAFSYQWQKRINGGAWTNVGNGTYDVYKPSPEPAAGTVDYRRLIIGFCCDTLSISNLATATITGTFNLSINAPTKPVYYCPGTTTNMGITLSGASGNVSWQWYDGYAPVSSTTISPASGSGVAASSFAASIGSGVTGSGFYRLVVIDAGGCRRETFVAIAPKVASAGTAASVALCPGTSTTAVLGPPAVNPDFDYSWTGPGGFTSSLANPVVTTAGVYTLQVKVKTDAAFCAPGTTVTVTAATPHSTALTTLSSLTVCQDDAPVSIGMTGTAPSGYAFQWVPATSLDNAQAFNPTFDPGVISGGFPIGTTTYTFTALRLSDGCIYETTKTVTDVALGFASAGNDLIGDGCTTGTRDAVGAPETTGQYFQWTAIGTDFSAGLSSLKANAAFGMDALGQQVGTNKFLNAKFPLCSANGSTGYYIDYELRASYLPFPNTCYTVDTVRVYIPCCGQGPACPIPTASLKGTNGACSTPTTLMSVSPLQGATYTWRTYSVNGTIQPANTAPRGLFVSNNGVKGAAISASGPHPTSVIVDFDDATWGWSGNNVVVYEVTQTIDLGNGPVSCFARLQVFSGRNALPVIGVKDVSICSIASPGVRFGTAGNAGPYTLSGLDYTQAPNSAFNWTWTGLNGSTPASMTNTTSPFPTVNPAGTTAYIVQVQDPATGCIAKDTLNVKVNVLTANAGSVQNNICPGSLVQLGSPASNTAITYSWNPTAGLNFPVGTPNSTVAQPYLAVPNVPTPPATLSYTLTITDVESGCQAVHSVNVNTTTTAPAALASASYSACAGSSFAIGPFFDSDAGSTYLWTVQSGTADVSWLSSTTALRPTVTLPANFAGPVVFLLTKTKGTCGSVTATFTINDSNPAINLGGPLTANCTSPYLQIGETALTGYSYTWTPSTGLFTNSGLTTAYSGGNTARPWVGLITAPTTYTVSRRNSASGCIQTASVTVNPPAGLALNAGADKSWCPGSPAVQLGSSGSGTITWTALAYSASTTTPSSPTAIASPMTSAQMLGYLSTTSGAVASFNQSSAVPGTYVYRLTATNGSCSITDDVVVKVPNFQTNLTGLPQTICKGSSVQLGVTNAPTTYNYSWAAVNPTTLSNTITNASSSRPIVSPAVTTTYQLVYTETATGCQADEQVTVVVNPGPSLSDVSTATVCAPVTAVNLTALIPNYSTFTGQQWYRDQYPGGVAVSTPTAVTPASTTDYFVVLADNLGCQDTVQVTVNVGNPQTPVIAASASVDCVTKTFDLATAQGNPSQTGYTLEWYTTPNRASGTQVTNLVVGVGTYYLFEKAPSPADCYSGSAVIAVTNTCPCVTPTSVSATAAPNLVTANATITLGVSASNTTPGSTTYTWSGSGISSPTATTVASRTVSAPATAGTYTYTVVVSNGSGCTATATASVTVQATASLGNFVFEDVNANGIQEPTDKPIPGVTVSLLSSGTLVASTTTNASGLYSFTGLTPGVPYSVSFTAPAGFTATSQNTGSDDALDSDGAPATGLTGVYNLTANENNLTVDMGYYRPASLGDKVFVDVNKDGQQDSGEPGLPNVTVTLLSNGTLVASTTTDASGLYSFTGLTPGVPYSVSFTSPTGYTATTPNAGNDATDSDPVNGLTAPVSLTSGETNTTLDAGFYVLTASLGNFVFEDVNANGLQEPADKPIPGVTVSLLNSGTLVASTTTNASGLYSFTGLTPGLPYSVSFTAPAGFTATSQNTGSDDALDSDGAPATGLTGVYNLTANENNTTVDMGYYKPASLGDKVFVDVNKDGQQDSGEPGLPNVTVTLLSNGTLVASTTTDASGLYSFTGLTPGLPYSVSFTSPTGYTATTPNAGNDATDSDPVNGLTAPVSLTSGENNPTLDAGFYVVPAMSVTLTSAPVCNSATNNYTATATVSLTGASAGTLTITDNGVSIGTVSVTAGQATATVSVTGLSDAASHTLVASLNGLSASTVYTAPAACTVCSLTAVANAVCTSTGATITPTVTGGTSPFSYSYAGPTMGVAVVTKDATHPYFGVGSTMGLAIDGIQGKELTLVRGVTYTFTVNTPGHPFVFTTSPVGGFANTSQNITVGVTSGSLTFTPTAATPDLIYYNCDVHDNMGWKVNVVDAQANGVLTQAMNGIYSLTVTDATGCSTTATTTVSCPCGLTATATPTVCNSATNQYSVSGSISLSNPSGNVVIVSDGSKTVSLPVSATTTSIAYSLTGLVSDGTSHTVTVSLAGCGTTSAIYSAPASCTVGLSVVVGTPVCNSLTNNYTATGTVSLTNASAGTLTITDNGTSLTTITVSAGQTTASFSVSGISNASSHTVVATLNNGLAASTVYTAPAACTVCSTSLTTTALANGQVGTAYSQTLTAAGGTAPYSFTAVGNLPAGLTLNPTTGEISGTPTSATTSSFTITVSDAKSCSDSQPLTITVGNAPVCSLTATATPGSCNTATNTYTVTGSVSATNTAVNNATTQSLTITDGTAQTVVTLTGDGPVSYTLAGLNSDGAVHTVTVLSSATACGMASVTYTAPASCTVAPKASLGDYVFEDVNANGLQEPTDKPIPGVTVSLLSSGTLVASTTTNASGLYSFTGLTPGVPYSVSFTAPAGFTATSQNTGSDDALDSDGAPATGLTGVYNLTANENNTTVDMGYYKPASLGDKVFVDVNKDGQQDSGEPGLPNVTVTLLSNGTLVASTTTDASGLYSFTGLTPGLPYSVSFTSPTGYTATTPNAGNDATDSDPVGGITQVVSLTSGETNPTLDAGFYVLTASLGDYVFEDVNANGIQEPTDKPIPGVTVSLLSSGTLVASTTTNASGLYSFTGLTPGVPYSVSFTAPAGFTATSQNTGSDDALDSDGAPATGLTGVYNLTANENNTTVDMGYYKPASLGDKVFVDVNKDGQQDSGEPGLPNVTVTLLSNGTLVASTTTDASGLYSFTGLTPGLPYSVSFTSPTGYTATTPNSGNDATDSDPVGGITQVVSLTSGETNPTLDAGFYVVPAMSITLTSGPVCNSATNNYTATAIVSLTGATAGTLTITDNGVSIGTVSVTAGQATATVSVTGLSDAASHTLVASLNGLSASTVYTAPAACTVCSTSLTTTALANGQVGTTYSQTLTAAGGSAPYSFTAVGSLPAGLTLNPTTGEISGTPTSATTSSFTITVSDAKSCSDSQPLTITVGNAPVCSLTATATPGSCNTTTNTYTVTGSVSATNTAVNNATTQSLTITDGTAQTIVTLTGDGPVSYTLAGLNSDGAVHTVMVMSSATACSMASVTYTAPASCTVAPKASLGDYVFEDVNANGLQDPADKPIPGVTVSLLSSGTLVASTTTNASGLYSFTGLTPGVPYSVSFTAPAGFTATSQNTGSDDALDSDGAPATGLTGVYNLTANENNTTVDMGYYKPASLGDKVFVDVNKDGQQDSGEPGLPNVTVTLLSNGTLVASTTTDASGLYSFTGLTPGVPYSVSFTSPTGYTATTPNAGNDATDSDPVGGITQVVSLTSGETNPTLDAGFYVVPAMSITLTSGPVCNSATNNYTATATVSLTGASAGTLTITDNGVSIGTVSVTAGQATATVSVTGLSDAASHTLVASLNGLSASTVYTAPVACTVCSLSLTVSPGLCQTATNTYTLNGSLRILNNTSGGTITVSDGLRSTTLTATSATTSLPFSLTGLPSDGTTHNLVATLSGCASASATYTAPGSCSQPAGTRLVVDKYVSASRAKLGDVLTYTLVLSNVGPTTATNVVVKDSTTTGLSYVAGSASVPTGTSFTPGVPVSYWSVAAISAGQSLSLTLQARVDSSGILYNQTSIPGDTATVCTSVPVKVCVGEVYTFRLTVAPGRASYQWYKDGLVMAGATTNVLDVSSPGSYSLAVDNTAGQCPDFSCCPFIVEEDTLPTFQAVALPATCVGATAQANGQIVLRGFQPAYTYQYSAGASFNPAASLSGAAKGIPASGVIVNTLANPVSSASYTVRVYNGSGCYQDVTVQLSSTACTCPPDVCTPFVIKQTKRGARIGDK